MNPSGRWPAFSGQGVIMYQGNLILEDRPQVVTWLKWLLGSILGLTFIIGLVFLTIDRLASLVMFAVTLFDAVLFYIIMPRSYQIFADRLKIVLGGPFGVNLPFKDIRLVKRVPGDMAFAANGLRFTTSNKYVLEITRKGKMSVLISPAEGELFVQQLTQTMKNYASG